MEQFKCGKCGVNDHKIGYCIVAVKFHQVNLCSKCYKEWYDLRDKLVEEAFQEFTKVEST